MFVKSAVKLIQCFKVICYEWFYKYERIFFLYARSDWLKTYGLLCR